MKSGREAITVVELLVVVAVIALLLGLAFPVYSRVVTSGKIAASTSNLTQLAAANLAYAAEHDGYYCPAQASNNLIRWHGARTSMSGAFDPTKGYLAPYLGNSGRVKICPLFTPAVRGANSFEDGTGGYGYNAAYIGGTPSSDPGVMFQPTLISRVPRSARTVMFTTTAIAKSQGLQENATCDPPFWDFGDGPSGSRPTPTVHFRANGKALVAWCDGHVSAEARQERAVGTNPYGGDASTNNLGWFGPDAENGYWNPNSSAP